MRIFWGIIWAGIGFLLIRYAFQITNALGRIDMAERYIGNGGTFTMYRIVGVVIIFLAFLYAFNLMGSILGPIAPLFGAAK